MMMRTLKQLLGQNSLALTLSQLRLMQQAVDHFQQELSGVRTGRAHPGLLENLLVDAEGDHIPIKACGSVTVRTPQLLAVVLFDTSDAEGSAKECAPGQDAEGSAKECAPGQVTPPWRQAPRIQLTELEQKVQLKDIRRRLERAVSVKLSDWGIINGLFNAYAFGITKYIDAEMFQSCCKFYREEFKPVVLVKGGVFATFTTGTQVFVYVQSDMASKLKTWLHADSMRPLWTTSPISHWFASMTAFVTQWLLDNNVSITSRHVTQLNAHPPKG